MFEFSELFATSEAGMARREAGVARHHTRRPIVSNLTELNNLNKELL